MIAVAKADAGWHPDYGEIIAGKEYEITGIFPTELFTIPAAPTEEEDNHE